MNIRSRIQQHWRNPDSHHYRIAAGFLWVGLFVLIGRLAGAAKEMSIAWRYGVSETVDAYVFLFNLLGLPVGVWFSVLTVVLVPLVARVRHEDSSTLPRFRSELLGLTLAAGAGMGCLSYWTLPSILEGGWAGLTGPSLQQARAMAGPLSLLVPMGLLISLFSAWMMASGHHRNTLLEALPALVVLGALLLPVGLLPEPLIWGTVAGFALQLAGLGWPLNRGNELPQPAFSFVSPAWRGFWTSFGIMAVGQSLMSVTGIIDQFFAAHLGPGAISTLSYANRIVSLIVSLGAMAISRAALPIFSEMAGKGKASELKAIARRWSLIMLLLGLVVMGVAWWFAPWGVGVLFERGAFEPKDTIAVAELLRFLLLQIPVYFSGIVFSMYMTSVGAYSRISLVAGACLPIKLILNYLLAPTFGLLGIAISTAAMYLFILMAMHLFITYGD